MSKPVQMKAAGGLVFRKEKEETEILLIFRNGLWDLPKGKLEEGESIPACAVREVKEEVGLQYEPMIKANLGTTEHSYVQDDLEIEKETYWFVMTLAEYSVDFTPQQAEGISKVDWVPVSRAGEIVGFQNLKNLIMRFRDHLS
ncbi:hypothetical protein BH23BAC3_BH23BAC3_25040 [soil metagenome]